MTFSLKFTPLLLMAAVGLTSLSAQQASEPVSYMQEYGQRGIPVAMRTGSSSANYTLVALQAGAEGNELVLQVPGGASSERLYIPVRNMEAFQIRFTTPAQAAKGIELLRQGDALGAVEALRPVAWPLVRYAVVPEKDFPIHGILRAFYQALVTSDQFDEALAFARELPLREGDSSFISSTLELARRLVADGQNDRGLNALNMVPTNAAEEGGELLISFADQLREQRDYGEALDLYRRVMSNSTGDTRRRALLWSAYCSVNTDRVESARILLREAGEIPRDAVDFSLGQLVKGVIAYQSKDYQTAIKEISQGVVFARIGYAWVPELLYMSGQCYEAMEQPDTARNIYRQVSLFFPGNIWATRSDRRLQELPSEPPASANLDPAQSS